jgi:hypothetical protein
MYDGDTLLQIGVEPILEIGVVLIAMVSSEEIYCPQRHIGSWRQEL